MKTVFTAHASDEMACHALKELSNKGHRTQVINDGGEVSLCSIAIFSVEREVRNKFLRLSTHRMTEEGVEVPQWAATLPFVVAMSASMGRADRRGLRVALDNMADIYGAWGPWMQKPEAPWNPAWKDGEKHRAFGAWRLKAQGAVCGVSCAERLAHRLRPIFEPRRTDEIKRLVVTGCALFNQPHTDVVAMIPKEKSKAALGALEAVVLDAGVNDVRFVVPREDLLRTETRDHFHPFMYMSIEDVARHLGRNVPESTRIRGRLHAHARNDEEIADALRASADALMHEIVQPLRVRTGIPIVDTTWSGYVGPYLERAYALAQKHRAFAEDIYLERVRTRPSYASLHKIDPERGLWRTISNNAFYIAEAMFLKDNPDTAVVNCEFADTFWRGLEQMLGQEVWGDFRPFIGMVGEGARQPWGY
jgi:hypothetical protein